MYKSKNGLEGQPSQPKPDEKPTIQHLKCFGGKKKKKIIPYSIILLNKYLPGTCTPPSLISTREYHYCLTCSRGKVQSIAGTLVVN